MTGHAWHDLNYEGKLLRKVLTRLQRRFMKEDNNEDADLDKLTKLAHMITLTAKTSESLVKHLYQDKQIKELQDIIESRRLTKYTDIGDLPVIT